MDLRTRMKTFVYYDVDTQNDFMRKDGRLYVPNAESIIPNIKRLTDYARLYADSMIVGSVDNHSEGDAELQRNGGPFPDHCIAGTYGQEKIVETLPVCPAYIPNEKMSFSRLESIIGDRREIFFEKQHYDVFTNPNAGQILENAGMVIVYGVATDYCVKAAVLGLRKLAIPVYVVEDAIAGVTEESSKRAIEEMKMADAKFISTDDIIHKIILTTHYLPCEKSKGMR